MTIVVMEVVFKVHDPFFVLVISCGFHHCCHLTKRYADVISSR